MGQYQTEFSVVFRMQTRKIFHEDRGNVLDIFHKNYEHKPKNTLELGIGTLHLAPLEKHFGNEHKNQKCKWFQFGSLGN